MLAKDIHFKTKVSLTTKQIYALSQKCISKVQESKITKEKQT